MKKYFNVSFQYSEGVFCANIAHAESAEAVEKHYSEKYEWCKVSEATAADVEEAQRRGKPRSSRWSRRKPWPPKSRSGRQPRTWKQRPGSWPPRS